MVSCWFKWSIPSGNLLHSHWKWLIEIVDLPYDKSWFSIVVLSTFTRGSEKIYRKSWLFTINSRGLGDPDLPETSSLWPMGSRPFGATFSEFPNHLIGWFSNVLNCWFIKRLSKWKLFKTPGFDHWWKCPPWTVFCVFFGVCWRSLGFSAPKSWEAPTTMVKYTEDMELPQW